MQRSVASRCPLARWSRTAGSHPLALTPSLPAPDPSPQGVPNDIDLIAASFVRKGSDLDYIRSVSGGRQAASAGRLFFLAAVWGLLRGGG